MWLFNKTSRIKSRFILNTFYIHWKKLKSFHSRCVGQNRRYPATRCFAVELFTLLLTQQQNRMFLPKPTFPRAFQLMPTVKVFKQTMSVRRDLGKMCTFVHLSASSVHCSLSRFKVKTSIDIMVWSIAGRRKKIKKRALVAKFS